MKQTHFIGDVHFENGKMFIVDVLTINNRVYEVRTDYKQKETRNVFSVSVEQPETGFFGVLFEADAPQIGKFSLEEMKAFHDYVINERGFIEWLTQLKTLCYCEMVRHNYK